MSETSVISVSLPEDMVRMMDYLAESTHQTRSELFRNALRAYVLNYQENAGKFEAAPTNKKKKKR